MTNSCGRAARGNDVGRERFAVLCTLSAKASCVKDRRTGEIGRWRIQDDNRPRL